MQKCSVGYQLYSVRGEAETDLDGVLGALKEMGYDGVEFAGFYGHSAQEVREMLDLHGLKGISSHVPLQQIEADMADVLSNHQILGCKYIAIPYLVSELRPGTPGFTRFVDVVCAFSRLAKGAGITVLYHNHDFEFEQIDGHYILDILYNTIPADLLQTQLDLGWVMCSGLDPAAYLRQYANRCPVVHLRDFVGNKQDATLEFGPIGYGCQDLPSLLQAGIESGTEWFIVEEDASPTGQPLMDAKKSIDTLIRLGLK